MLKKPILVLTLLIFSSIVIIGPMNTLATDPNEVDVTIVIYELKYLTKDTDTFSAGDIYFAISHSTTQTSDVATDDYEDGSTANYDLENDDFDEDGYFDKQYDNIRLNTGLLDWVIEVYDEDSGADKLLFQGILTVKDTDSTGEVEYDDVRCYAEYYGEVILESNYHNSYLIFSWEDGEHKNGVFNGLVIWVTLNYHI